MPTPDTLTSPRITALKEDLAAGNRAALDVFWQEVTRSGTPLIEPVADDKTHVWVTFLWRAKEPVENIRIIRGLTSHDPQRAELCPVPDTDLWYRSFCARADTRTSYLYLLKGSGVQFDPLNSKTYPYPRDEDHSQRGGFVVSVLELPQAPPQPWLQPQPNVPLGHTKRHSVSSTILKNDRRVWVYTPAGYTVSDPPYHMLLLLDDWAYAQVMHAPTTLDNLIAAGKIPPVVALLMDSPDRMQEWLCSPPFADFLAQELIPWAHQHYRLTHEPAQTIIGGMSAGGLAAAYASLRYPEVFGNVLAQSAAFWWRPPEEREPEWLARQFATAPRRPVKFYLEVGLLEDWIEGDEGVSQLVSTRHLRNVLQAKGYSVVYAEFSGDHDEICWQGTLANGLVALFHEEGTGA